jgi:RNA polymerase sigma-70 factor, ECF subfamily
MPADGRRLRLVGSTTEESEDLLPRVAAGELAAFGELYDALAPAVYGLARRVVRDPGAAEDVTQEVFTEAWRQAARYDPARGSARGWLLTITHRRAVDAVRSLQAARSREERVTREAPTLVPDVDGQVIEAEERSAVHRCLEALTPLQRESVVLAFYQGYTYPQVATLLGRPLPTIKTRMRDGLIRLRDCLEASDER